MNTITVNNVVLSSNDDKHHICKNNKEKMTYRQYAINVT